MENCRISSFSYFFFFFNLFNQPFHMNDHLFFFFFDMNSMNYLIMVKKLMMNMEYLNRMVMFQHLVIIFLILLMMINNSPNRIVLQLCILCRLFWSWYVMLMIVIFFFYFMFTVFLKYYLQNIRLNSGYTWWRSTSKVDTKMVSRQKKLLFVCPTVTRAMQQCKIHLVSPWSVHM